MTGRVWRATEGVLTFLQVEGSEFSQETELVIH